MSGSTAFGSDNSGGLLDISATASGSVAFLVGDVNNQPMPAKTVIALTAPTGVTVSQPSSFTFRALQRPAPCRTP